MRTKNDMGATAKHRKLSVSLPEYAIEDIRNTAEKMGWTASALAGQFILNVMYDRLRQSEIATPELTNKLSAEELKDYLLWRNAPWEEVPMETKIRIAERRRRACEKSQGSLTFAPGFSFDSDSSVKL